MFRLQEIKTIKNVCAAYQQKLLTQIEFNQRLFNDLKKVIDAIEREYGL